MRQQSASRDKSYGEIDRHREVWDEKPLVRKVYRDFYRRIAAHVTTSAQGLTVELGSGLGKIKEIIPNCITSDVFANTWLDRSENCYKLSFADESVANLILFDVWHHLQFPGTALAEFERVLVKGGRVILFEPEMGFLGKLIYNLAHREPVGFRQPIQWFAPPGFVPADAPYFSAQSRAHRVFVRGEYKEMLKSWTVVEVCRLCSLSYLCSGGFNSPQFCPTQLFPLLDWFDRVLSLAPSLFAVRLLVVLEKRA